MSEKMKLNHWFRNVESVLRFMTNHNDKQDDPQERLRITYNGVRYTVILRTATMQEFSASSVYLEDACVICWTNYINNRQEPDF